METNLFSGHFDKVGTVLASRYGVMLDIPSAIVHCFIVTLHCCVLCVTTQGSLSLGISNINPDMHTVHARE